MESKSWFLSWILLLLDVSCFRVMQSWTLSTPATCILYFSPLCLLQIVTLEINNTCVDILISQRCFWCVSSHPSTKKEGRSILNQLNKSTTKETTIPFIFIFFHKDSILWIRMINVNKPLNYIKPINVSNKTSVWIFLSPENIQRVIGLICVDWRRRQASTVRGIVNERHSAALCLILIGLDSATDSCQARW